MEKTKKYARFLKNRMWKSKVAHRLKGRPDEICLDYLSGSIDQQRPIHATKGAQDWLSKFMKSRKLENQG